MPSSDLRVSVVQAATVWHDAAANRALYGDLVRPLAGQSDLIVLPETFTLLQLQRVVEALLGRMLHKQNFRRLVEQQQLAMVS